MLELKVHQSDIGAEIHCSGSFVLGLLPDQYELMEVQKIHDGTENFLVAYQNLRFTVSEETAKSLLKLGATLSISNLSFEDMKKLRSILGHLYAFEDFGLERVPFDDYPISKI